MDKSRSKGRVAQDETFDEFLAREGMLAEAEELALKEIIADQIRSDEGAWSHQDRNGCAHEN